MRRDIVLDIVRFFIRYGAFLLILAIIMVVIDAIVKGRITWTLP